MACLRQRQCLVSRASTFVDDMAKFNLTAIREKFQAGRIEFSEHAVDQSILREISVQEIRDAITECEIIEDYPADKYGPSCLILGYTRAGRPLHIHCSYPSRPLIKIITLYEPQPTRWIDFKTRKGRHD